MFVERHGRGPRAFFALHGWGGDRRAFAPLAPFVPPAAALYAADLPGCGDSPAPRRWTVGAIVSEIVEATRVTEASCVTEAPRAGEEARASEAARVSETGRGSEATRLTLVGACGGAVFALLAAERLGERVERVVMIDPFAYLPRYLRIFLAGEFGRRAYGATFANPVGRWLTNQSLRGRRAGAGDLTASFAGVDHEAERRYLALYDEVGGVERFRGFPAPVEILYGEKTFGAVRRSLALWLDVLPRARVRELKGAGHQAITEATAETARLIFEPAGAAAVSERGAERAREAELARGVVGR